jgi:hypothetical protein
MKCGVAAARKSAADLGVNKVPPAMSDSKADIIKVKLKSRPPSASCSRISRVSRLIIPILVLCRRLQDRQTEKTLQPRTTPNTRTNTKTCGVPLSRLESVPIRPYTPRPRGPPQSESFAPLRPCVFALKKFQRAMTGNESGIITVEADGKRHQRKVAKAQGRKEPDLFPSRFHLDTLAVVVI